MGKKKNEKPVTDDPQEESVQTQYTFPIIGIGASAGGLAAFQSFFSGMPADVSLGMAFVLVQHLVPDHKSLLTELVQHCTRMKVFEVKDGMTVNPDCVYIIPPGRDMALKNGMLRLLKPAAPRGQRLPIDFFFRSLAQELREQAVCIILSGTGTDGTLGVQAVKGVDGMVMVQRPESTEYDGMSRSAMATGLVDYELAPSEMPAQLMTYLAHAFGTSPGDQLMSGVSVENALKTIFALLRTETGHDFSQYKLSTVSRRIERRMMVNQIESVEGYVKFLQKTPHEVEALFRDLLIGVTSFFRDPAAFRALAKAGLPRIFAGKPSGSVIRVWVPGCSTGEEAYSIAMLLLEQMEILKQCCTIQIFATDIDSRAIATARAGIYPAGIATDIPPERLARFFTVEPGGGYRIHKAVRELMVFSEQDVIKDPPFSGLDFISCRNLLIYLSGSLQKKLIALFHYSLKPGGILFLGTSGSTGDRDDLFDTLDRMAKLYQRKQNSHSIPRMMPGRILPMMRPGAADPADTPPPGTSSRQSLRQITEQALLRYAIQFGALVNGRGDILYLHGKTGLYLEPVTGESGINNILKMAREGLQRELTMALYKASSGKVPVHHKGLCVKTNGHYTLADLTVFPMGSVAVDTPLYLVVLNEAAGPEGRGQESGVSGQMPDSAGFDTPSVDARIEALQKELRAKEEYLQAANEELETSNEELLSANEEMQSTNEELQSTNEELETSKEELQSVNEELSTVNTELQSKVADLSQANNDMNNLLAGTGIGTVFVDLNLRILRFTPAATRIINLIPGDVGRPVGHVVSNLPGYDSLVPDVQSVLDTLIPKEVAVQATEGRWYTLRIQPYRTLNNVIEGAVITFVDITDLEKAKALLRKANRELALLAVVVRDSSDAITVQELDGRITVWNPSAVQMYGWSEGEALAMNVRDRIPEPLREDELDKLVKLSQLEILEPRQTQRIAKDGRVLEVWLTATALTDESGQVYAVSTTERLVKNEGC